jgi:rare lipoprotein A (peptidoglycan hydrolase)
MQFKNFISILLAGTVFVAPGAAQAISQPTFYPNSKPTHEFGGSEKWFPTLNLHSHQLASVQYGTASWYGPGFYGKPTASGEIYRPGTYTVAHPYLPMGTRVRVTNLSTGASATARVNDRGPFVGGRIVDLGHGIASYLGITRTGLGKVKLEVLR